MHYIDLSYRFISRGSKEIVVEITGGPSGRAECVDIAAGSRIVTP
jgi:hypothetical protein